MASGHVRCLPGVAAHSPSLREGTASSNPSSSSGESANHRFLSGEPNLPRWLRADGSGGLMPNGNEMEEAKGRRRWLRCEPDFAAGEP